MKVYGYDVEIISTEVFEGKADVFEITEHTFVPTWDDAINLLSLLTHMGKGIMAAHITEIIDPDQFAKE